MAEGLYIHRKFASPQRTTPLSQGADVNATTTHGRTPLEYAVNPPLPLTRPENSEEIAAILKKAGAK